MRMLVLATVCFCLLLPVHTTLDQDYLQLYTALNEAERVEKNGDTAKALSGYEACYEQLVKIRQADQDWEPVLVKSRMDDCRAKVIRLEYSLGIPLNSPPATGAAASAAVHPANAPFVFNNWPPDQRSEIYPWKNSIVTTVFWIGKGSSASGWDPNWERNNGGGDNEFSLSGYAPKQHASTLNPFYVALPFNDLTHPELAARWLPRGWYKPPCDGKAVSARKNRWIELKSQSGRCCFAQWEDVGPAKTDDAAYVFGSDRPIGKRGLDVSPAVAKYLGFTSGSSLSWRFVDNDGVPPGLWLRYDEQAVLFRAMRLAQAANGT